jgi:nucleoside-diphosphate kinase
MAYHLPERTFIALKPDGVIRELVGEIITRFEKKGYEHPLKQNVILILSFELVALKLVQPSKTLVEEHCMFSNSTYVLIL